MRITITKVVTRNFILDFVSKIQNLIGINLSFYERMVQKGTDQIEKEILAKGYKLKKYEYQITQLNNDAIVVMLYGETQDEPEVKE
jgi:uncharacterized protein YbjQ (UPF0145 family)